MGRKKREKGKGGKRGVKNEIIWTRGVITEIERALLK